MEAVLNDMHVCRVTHIMKTDMFAPEAQGSVGVIQLEDALRMEPFAREGEEEEEEDHGDMMGGEPQFVARDPAAMAAKKCAYDDGYLVLYATHLKDGDMTSYFMVCFVNCAPLFLSLLCACRGSTDLFNRVTAIQYNVDARPRCGGNDCLE